MTIEEGVKKLLAAFEESNKFNEINGLFLDLSEQQEFLSLGVVKDNNQIKETITTIAKKIVKNASIKEYLAIYVDKFKLWHGPFLVNGMVSTFFYFEELGKGMVAIARGKGRTEFCRFSLIKNAFYSNKSSKYTN